MAVDASALIAVAIQGTALSPNPTDILIDICIIREEVTLCGMANTKDGCEIYSILWSHARFARHRLQRRSIRKAANPTYQILTTGHSLGAAVAALLDCTRAIWAT